ncbi:MAG: hypothetical protein WCT02_00800 [Candidatus Paceibacterota bacterium]
MSTTAKTGIILVIVLAVIVIGGIWYGASTTTKVAVTNDQSLNANPTQSPTPVAPTVPVYPNMSDSGDDSDAAIQKDANAIDDELKGLGADSTSVDTGISSFNQ